MNQVPTILAEHRSAFFVSKPSGWWTHPTELDRSDHASVLTWAQDQLGRKLYPVHRLDRATSGILVFATGSTEAEQLSAQFREHTAQKEYLCLVRGWMETQVCDYPLRKLHAVHGKGLKPRGPRSEATVQPASTGYICLEKYEAPWSTQDRFATTRYSLVQALPRTGRTHQIRRHCKHLGHPIAGDIEYGKGLHNRLLRENTGLHRLFLHAASLGIEIGGELIKEKCPMPHDLESTRTFLSKVDL